MQVVLSTAEMRDTIFVVVIWDTDPRCGRTTNLAAKGRVRRAATEVVRAACWAVCCHPSVVSRMPPSYVLRCGSMNELTALLSAIIMIRQELRLEGNELFTISRRNRSECGRN